MNLVTRREVAACVLMFVCAVPVHAQVWPTKAVRWLVPFPPGSASDITARVLADRLTAAWGQTVLVENRPGAGGTIATAELVRAAADGYTIMSGTMGTHAIAPNLYSKLSFDPAKDLVAVNLVADVPLVLVAAPSVPANNLAEMVALARQSPGKYAYASPGNGTLNHLVGELFKQSAKLDMTHIPYKGAVFVYPDMSSGMVSLMFDPILSASTQVKQGKLKALAIAAPKRSPALPDVPTMAELGYAGFDATLWLGVFAPAQTPAPIVAKLSADLTAAVKVPDVRAKLEALGGEVVGMPHAEFSRTYARDLSRWAKTVKALGIKLD